MGWGKRCLVILLSFLSTLGIVMVYSNLDDYSWTDAVGSGIFVMSFYGPVYAIICMLLVFFYDWVYKKKPQRAVYYAVAAMIVVTGVVTTTLIVMDGLDELDGVVTFSLVASGYVVNYVWYLVMCRSMK